MTKIDMHVHTTASDGEFSPIEVIDYSLSKKLNGIAITDHDTVEGINEGIKYASNLTDYIIVPGIELSSEFHGEEIHILGYFINRNSEQLNNILVKLKESRVLRAKKIVSRLNKEGIKISYAEVEKIAGADVIGRPHIAKILMKYGHSKSMQKAFQEFLVKGSKTYVPRYKLDMSHAIDLIKKANGKVVLAHPGLIKESSILNHGFICAQKACRHKVRGILKDDSLETLSSIQPLPQGERLNAQVVIKKKELIETILRHDFDGIETYYPNHSMEDIHYFEALAKKHKLICTGGSDFHQIPTGGDIHEDLGTCSTSLEVIADWKREFDLRIKQLGE
ncbi:MAG: PHP domain-containing protein [Alkaliphilus sp.]